MLRSLGQDIRLAVRALARAPLVFIPAVATLALAIGANTAVFSVVNALLLRPLPVPHPERLFWISSDYATSRGFRAGAGWNHAMWEELRTRSNTFAGVLAWRPQRFVLGTGETEPVDGFYGSGGFFTTLGVRPLHGRLFTADDDRIGGGSAGLVGVISHRLWQRRFARRDDVIGSSLIVNGVPVTIIGVTPASFRGLENGRPFDLGLPLGAEPAIQRRSAGIFKPRSFLLLVLVRLSEAQPVDAATTTLRGLQAEIVPASAPTNLTEPFTLVPVAGGTGPVSPEQVYSRPLGLLLAGVTLVLLVASVNIANLMLARAIARRRELSVRLALGASHWRAVRSLTTESLVLAAIGAALGLVLASWGARAIVALTSLELQPTLDWRVIAFTGVASCMALVLFSVGPALRATRVAPAESLKGAARVTGAPHHLSGGLVVLQIALALVLVVASGLLVRTFEQLANRPLGFDAGRVLIASVDMARMPDAASRRIELYRQFVETVGALPGVEHAAASRWTPLSGQGGSTGISETPDRSDEVNVLTNFVTPGWFSVYGTPLIAGRDFTDADAETAPEVVVVNEAFARRFLPGRSAIGDTVSGKLIVGLAGDAVYRTGQRVPGISSLAFREPVQPTMYAPLAQLSLWDLPPSDTIQLSVRPRSGAPSALAPAIRVALAKVDPDLAFEFRPLSDFARESLAQERLSASLSLFFGLLSSLLAAVGLYGVTSYATSRRYREIGIRAALGATRADIVRLILRRALMAIGLGIAIGLCSAAMLTGAVASMIFGVSPHDPATFIVASLSVAAVATIAAFVPAYRASRVNPSTSLRAE